MWFFLGIIVDLDRPKRENWLRKNGIKITGVIKKFKLISTPNGLGEFTKLKTIIAEAKVNGEIIQFQSEHLYPEKKYRMPSPGESADIYYKPDNVKVYFVDIVPFKQKA